MLLVFRNVGIEQVFILLDSFDQIALPINDLILFTFPLTFLAQVLFLMPFALDNLLYLLLHCLIFGRQNGLCKSIGKDRVIMVCVCFLILKAK